jgi:hypothetical protein
MERTKDTPEEVAYYKALDALREIRRGLQVGAYDADARMGIDGGLVMADEFLVDVMWEVEYLRIVIRRHRSCLSDHNPGNGACSPSIGIES